jgi:hypothetical protein
MRILRLVLVFAIALSVMLPAAAAPASSPKPNKMDDANKDLVARYDQDPKALVAMIHEMQTDPYGKGFPDSQTLMRYIMSTKKMTIRLHVNVVGPLIRPPAGDYVSRLLLSEFAGGLVLYALDHGNKAGTDVESNVAGLNAMLAAYSKMLEQDASKHCAFADEIQRNGSLDSYVSSALSHKVEVKKK